MRVRKRNKKVRIEWNSLLFFEAINSTRMMRITIASIPVIKDSTTIVTFITGEGDAPLSSSYIK